MAVAFSTGGSGYTRSDFMISDAALPQRVEEAVQADQTDKFSVERTTPPGTLLRSWRNSRRATVVWTCRSLQRQWQTAK